MNDPLLRKRRDRRPIGYSYEDIERYVCLGCARATMLDDAALVPLVEGDDAGVPFVCERCDRPLTPDTTIQVRA